MKKFFKNQDPIITRGESKYILYEIEEFSFTITIAFKKKNILNLNFIKLDHTKVMIFRYIKTRIIYDLFEIVLRVVVNVS